MTNDAITIKKVNFEWKRFLWLSIGIILFVVVYYAPPWADAVDPMGERFSLSRAKVHWPFFCWPAPGGSSKWCPSE